MKKTGYDQFFKKALENADGPAARPPRQPGQRKIRFSEPEDFVQKKPLDQKQLASQLRARLEQNKQAKRKARRKSGISWRLAGVSFLGLVLAAAGSYGKDKVESWVKRVEITMIGSAQAETEKPADKAGEKSADAKPGEKSADKKADGKTKDEKAENKEEAAPKREFTDEEINHFMKLNERKHELDAREEELNRLEAELTAQKAELEKKMQNLEKTRRDISSVLEERVKTDDKKVDTLVQMYSNMKPAQAAKVFETMDEDLAVEIIGRMKKKNAAEIMDLIKPEKAKTFTEKFAGYKRS